MGRKNTAIQGIQWQHIQLDSLKSGTTLTGTHLDCIHKVLSQVEGNFVEGNASTHLHVLYPL